MGPTPAWIVDANVTEHGTVDGSRVIFDALAPHFCVYVIVARRETGVTITNEAVTCPLGVAIFVNAWLN
jgi:hypothetical protein